MCRVWTRHVLDSTGLSHLGLASCPTPSLGRRVLCPGYAIFKHTLTKPESPLFLGSRPPGHDTPAPPTVGPGIRRLETGPEPTETIQTSHPCPRLSLLPLPVTGPGASPCGPPVTCCGALSPGICEYNARELSCHWQSSPDLWALPCLNNN